jgi:hypothetical protein
MYFFAIYVANTSNGHKFNFYKVKKNMTEIIEIILNEALSLHCEKNNTHICVVHVVKTITSGCRICH